MINHPSPLGRVDRGASRETGEVPSQPRENEDRLLNVEHLGLNYGVGPDVLKDVSLSLAPGEMCFLAGPSGAGKSSLLRILLMAQKPTRGTVSLFGQDVTEIEHREKPALRRRLGVVFQDFRLIEHLSVFDNVAMPLRVAGKKRRDYLSDVKDLLDWVGLGNRMDALPETLSGGEKQRAAIARAVISKPELVLADEPTGNVDSAMAKRLLHLFLELNRGGTTILIASHDEELMRQSKKRVLTLADGKVMA
jgi:cell division transport system ATP-binding protein